MLNTYHAKLYLNIRTGSELFFTLFLGFGSSPFLKSKMTERVTNELALVDHIGSDVKFASRQNVVPTNFLFFD